MIRRIVRATEAEKREMREVLVSLDEFNHAGRSVFERNYHSLRKIRDGYLIIVTTYDLDDEGNLVSSEYRGEFVRCECGAVLDHFGEEGTCYKCGRIY